MKYIIERTSAYDECPHPDAEKVIIDRIRDIRTFKSKEEWLKKFPRDEHEAIEWGTTPEGNPFRILARGAVVYMMEIPDLIEFVKANGQIVLKLSGMERVGYENIPVVEIYDNYRE